MEVCHYGSHSSLTQRPDKQGLAVLPPQGLYFKHAFSRPVMPIPQTIQRGTNCSVTLSWASRTQSRPQDNIHKVSRALAIADNIALPAIHLPS